MYILNTINIVTISIPQQEQYIVFYYLQMYVNRLKMISNDMEVMMELRLEYHLNPLKKVRCCFYARLRSNVIFINHVSIKFSARYIDIYHDRYIIIFVCKMCILFEIRVKVYCHGHIYIYTYVLTRANKGISPEHISLLLQLLCTIKR